MRTGSSVTRGQVTLSESPNVQLYVLERTFEFVWAAINIVAFVVGVLLALVATGSHGHPFA